VTEFVSSEDFHGKDGLMIEYEPIDSKMYNQIITDNFEDHMYNYFKQYYEKNDQKISLVSVGPLTNIAYTI